MWWGLFKPYGYYARIWCRSSLFESKPGYFVIFSLGNTYFSNSLSLPRSINRIRTLFQKQVLRTFPGSRLIFPRLQISPHSFSFPRFQNKFSLRSTYISYKVNSEIFIARVSHISRTFQNLQSFFKTFQSWKMSK